jgi:hypothetical protein
MDLTLLANLEDVPAVKNYIDKNLPSIDYNSPLYQAQIDQMAYMAAKQRKPMVIEYYEPKGFKGNVPENESITSVEMYINPERLTMQTQKINSKTITRGGIFYHHAGDDHWQMQLSGTVGLSGMKGIEQLEKIYYHSGALLRYTDLGPDSVNSSAMPSTYEQINLEDPFAGLSYILNSNDVGVNNVTYIKNLYQKVIAEYKIHKDNNNMQVLNSKTKLLEICLALLNNYQNVMKLASTRSSYNQLYSYLNAYVADNTKKGRYIDFKSAYQECQKRIKQVLSDIHPQLQIIIAYDLAKTICNYQNNSQFDISTLINNANSSGVGKMLDDEAYTYIGNETKLYNNTINDMYYDTGKLRAEALSSFIGEVQAFNEQNKIDRSQAGAGWLDIKDEVNDEWKPRQVFIYFEDRVYIGHFDSFSWNREASTPLIKYDMRFTVTRQIIITSTGNKPKPNVTRKQTTKIPSDNNSNAEFVFEDKLKYYASDSTSSKDDAVREIVRIKEAYATELEFDIINKQITSNERIAEVNNTLKQIRKAAGFLESDILCGTRPLTKEQRLGYYGTSSYLTEGLDATKRQLSYVKALIASKKQSNTLDPVTKRNILTWLISIHEAAGITKIEPWENEII